MNDNFSIRGEVKLVDRQGNVLIDDHNMVVKLGRTFIRNKVLGISGTSTVTISKLKFGYSSQLTEVTEDDDELDDIKYTSGSFTLDNSVESDISSIDENVSTFFKYKVSNVNNESPYIKYVLYIHDDPIGIINQLGLFTSDNKLFSKLNFEDVAITNDRDYLLIYTLYF